MNEALAPWGGYGNWHMGPMMGGWGMGWYGSASVQKGDEEVVVEYIVMEYIPGATLRFTMSEDGFYPEGLVAKIFSAGTRWRPGFA